MKYYLFVFAVIVGLVFGVEAKAQAPSVQWQKTLGGTNRDMLHHFIKTNDNNYILVGETSSNDGDVTGQHGNKDVWVVKVNPVGDLLWQKTFGGTLGDFAHGIIQTTDSGYVLCGGTQSNNGDVSGNHGGTDLWVVKLSSSGAIQWQKSFGGTSEEYGTSIIQTSDGGYAIGAATTSNDGDVSGNHGGWDAWIVKISSIGDIEWQHAFGGPGEDALGYVRIIQTNDNGFVFATGCRSNGGDVSGNHGGDDLWVVKLNQLGILQWQKPFGGTLADAGWDLVQSDDGGLIVAGSSNSNDGDVSGNHGGYDYWIIKIDLEGMLQWQKSYGGTSSEKTTKIIKTSDGGFAVAGYSSSIDGDVSGNHGLVDGWFIEIDSSGILRWQKSFGGTNDEILQSLVQLNATEYVVCGYTLSNDGNVSGNHGDFDGWVVKFTTKFLIKSVSPTLNALSTPVSTNITAKFNVSMNTATLNTSNILVYGSQSGKHTGTISFTGDTMFTFNPITDFKPGEIVNVTLTKNILSASGDSLTNGYHWGFTIANSTSSGTFAAKVDYVTGDTPYSVVASDIDSDGDADMLVANRVSNSVSVLKNNGNGTFSTKVDYATGSGAFSVYASDIDGDGDVDMLVANSFANSVSVLKNNGDGTFATKVDYGTGTAPYTVYASDIDGDGDYDIFVANSDTNSVSILKNNGDGTFANKVDYVTGTNPNSVYAGDIDSDGDVDMIVPNFQSNTISVLKNNGDGTFTNKVDYVAGANPNSVFMSDIDGDSDGDMIVANFNSNTISVLKNNGDGIFSDKLDYSTGTTPVFAYASDVDGDIDLDMIVANANSNTISVLKNNGNGIFSTKADYGTGNGPLKVFPSDINGDGVIDILVANNSSNTVSVLIGNNALKVISTSPLQNALNTSKSTNISAAFNVLMNTSTLNASNILVYGSQSGKHTGTISFSSDTMFTFNPTTDFKQGEIVNVTLTKNILSAGGDSLTNGYHWSFTIANSTSSGTFAAKVDYVTGNSPRSVFVADLDGDGDGDLAVPNYSSQNVSILKNNGNGTFGGKVDYSTGVQPRSIFISDLDGDSDGDLAIANVGSNTVSILKNNGDGTFANRIDYATGTSPRSGIIGDIDGDGDGDIITANNGASTVSVLKNNGDGTFATKVDYATGNTPQAVLMSDIDGDGDLDLAVVNQNSNTISILKNNGNGTFATKNDYSTGSEPASVYICDLDGDGDGELVVVNTNSTDKTISILLNNGNGTFATKVDYAAGTRPQEVFVNDIDGDGDGDLVVTNSDSNKVFLFKNNGNGTFATKIDYEIGTLTQGVFLSDVDGDGDGDMIVTNVASNTISVLKNINPPFTEVFAGSLTGVNHSSAAWGDYDNDGDLDILLSGRDVSDNRISKIYQNTGIGFTEVFAGALVGTFVSSVAWGDYDNDGDLDILLTGLNSSNVGISKIYQNTGSGFTEVFAGSLPGFWRGSVAWGDYDNDGDLDILLTGYSSSSVPTSKIYQNTGSGFTEVFAGSLSGVRFSSVAWGDYDNDGDLDILLTGDNGSISVSKIYQNTGSSFTEVFAGSLTGVSYSSAAWGDYDNDGDLDILLTGYPNTGIEVSKIYQNTGSGFTEVLAGNLTGVYESSATWGDYDNDGDLDILLTGIYNSSGSPTSKIYQNNGSVFNTAPNTPTGLTATPLGSGALFYWNKSTDTQTQQNGLSYNLRVGTSASGVDKLSPMANVSNGYRRVVHLGNTNLDTTWTMKNLPDGSYKWSVQAIDNAFAGSNFATEGNFAIRTQDTIISSSGSNGSITPSGLVAVTAGANQQFVFTPSTGYHVDSVIVDGTKVDSVLGYTFSNVTANHTIRVTFAINTYTLTPISGTNGSIDPSSAVTVNYGTNQRFIFTPSTGYHLDSVIVDGIKVDSTTGYTFNNVTANHTIRVTFVINTYTLTPTTGANGSIDPSSPVTLNYGASQRFTFTPSTGYHLDSVIVDGIKVDSIAGYTFNNVTANHTIRVTFAINTYTLTPTTGANGSIDPSSPVTVNYGASQRFTFTPSTGYHLDSVIVDGTKVDSIAGYTFNNVTANHTIRVTFAINTYTLTPTSGTNGSIDPSSTVTVNYGTNQRFIFIPSTGYHLDSVIVDGIKVDSIEGYTFNNITANHTIRVTFAINTYTLSPTSGTNGSIDPSSPVTINYGASQRFIFSTSTGYHLDSIIVDGTKVDSVLGYTFNNVTANHTIRVTFAINTYTLTPTAGANGSIDPSSPVTVNYGASQRFTFTPNACYRVDSVIVDGVKKDSIAGYTFANVTANHTINVTFAVNKDTITATAGANGSINPSGIVIVNCGANQRFTFIPSTGYQVDSVIADGIKVDSVLGYTFNNVTTNHTIRVTFSFIPTTISGKKFHDLNGNGTKELSETGLSGWEITLKKNGTEVARDTTDTNGDYSFNNISAGKYVVREIQQSGWAQTSQNPDTITIGSGTNVTGINFGNGHRGSICGIKYEDKNGNGHRDSGEPGLQGWTIQISGTATAFLQTDPSGNYCFTNLLPGYYIVTEAQQGGWKQTQGGYNIQLSSGKDTTCDFGNFKYGSISGINFLDLNANGGKQPNEPGIENWKISLFKNNSPTSLTFKLTASNGSFSFDSLLAGNYCVMEEERSGWYQTTSPVCSLTIASGSVFAGQNFGNIFRVGCNLIKGWNMVSPSVKTISKRKQDVFPQAISQAFRYEGGYMSDDSLDAGVGYWLKFPNADSINIPGEVISSDTIAVKAGWNLIGSISTSVSESCVQSIGTTIQSQFFEYNNGYLSSSSVKPCKAYWVKVSNDGQVILKSCAGFMKR